jgi:3-hydroxyisobutyrate dehydrogenase
MGSAIATNLLSRGHEVHVYNRTMEKTRVIAGKGATVHGSPKDLASTVDILITSLTDDKAIEEVAFGNTGFLQAIKKSSLWIEMSTIDPDASIKQAAASRQLGISRLEVPIVGNPEMEMQEKVILLAAGPKELFEKYEKFLNELGNPVLYLGPEGAGLRMKLVVNMYLGLNAESYSEAFVLSRKLGFAPDAFVSVLNKTAHRNFVSEVKGPKIATNDFQPSFSMDNLLKDLRLAQAEANKTGAVLPVSKLVTDEFEKANAHGNGKKDFSAIVLEIERLNGLGIQA